MSVDWHGEINDSPIGLVTFLGIRILIVLLFYDFLGHTNGHGRTVRYLRHITPIYTVNCSGMDRELRSD